jgi:hypothetical protein
MIKMPVNIATFLTDNQLDLIPNNPTKEQLITALKLIQKHDANNKKLAKVIKDLTS